ncbi:hypothetical protein BV22DRAFT_1129254 [Leucogyrophana mollusca]|uniref:Uncharacterized protein n=1 Tax=Leucogyrophana mollusca TaxID=85980 RepID=A0ACB8BHB8_9AGAM|nr:hypothetical protein BV22DRAFT_1129254 [Leucogyrophana mollusca]
MHRALLISDIILDIVQCCTITDHRGLDIADGESLARLARTCRFFQEPALDALWAELESIHPLIRCLPGDVWMRRGSTVFYKKYLSPRHWITFHKYASRIRVLKLPKPLSTTIQTLIALDDSPASAPLFPRLRHLEWFDTNAERLSYLRLFLAPSLVVLKADLRGLSESDPNVLSSLHTICPLIRTAVFTKVPESKEAVAAISQAVCGWRHLQILQCDRLNKAAWAHVLRTPGLTVGDFHLPPRIAEFARTAGVPSSSSDLFPSLSDLRLSSRNVNLATTLIEMMNHTPTTFQLIVEHTPSSQSIHALFNALSERVVQSPSQLLLTGPDGDDPPVITLEKMEPLLNFSSLRVLEMDSFCTFFFDDEALTEMALAWPNLETLWLYRKRWEVPSGITFQGLFSLVQLCPKLNRLALAFDATAMDSALPISYLNKVSNHAVKHLHVMDTHLDDPPVVALALLSLFAGLERVHYSDGELAELWDEVNVMLAEYRPTILA